MTTTPYTIRALGDSAVKNLIINGNMDFWQRGTSTTVNAANLLQADRFYVYNPGAFNVVYSRSTDVPTVTQSGWQSGFSTLLTWGGSPSNGTVIQYRMEGNDYQALHGGKKVRLQFWAKSSTTGTYGVTLENAAETRVYGTSYTITNANTWQKVTLDVPTDTTGTWAFDNTLGLIINFGAGGTVSGSTVSSLNSWQTTTGARSISTQVSQVNGSTFQLAQVALYSGSFDPALSIPFQRIGRSIGHELQLCQRYFCNSNGTAVSSGSQIDYLVTSYNGGNFVGQFLSFPTTMRATPTITVTDGNGNAGKIFAAFSNDSTAGSQNQTPPSGTSISTAGWAYVSGGFTFPNNATITDSLAHAVRIGVFGHAWTAESEL